MKKPFTEQEFSARLAALGLVLDEKAFAADWKGAQHLRDEVGRIEDYLKT